MLAAAGQKKVHAGSDEREAADRDASGHVRVRARGLRLVVRLLRRARVVRAAADRVRVVRARDERDDARGTEREDAATAQPDRGVQPILLAGRLDRWRRRWRLRDD